MAERVGLDLSPIDPFSDDAARAGCWPASGRTTRRCSAACEARAFQRARCPRPTRHGSSRATWWPDLPRARRLHGRPPPARRVPLLGGRLPQRGATTRPRETGAGARGPPGPCTTSTARPPSRRPVCPRRRRRSGATGRTSPPRSVHVGPGGAEPVRLADTHPHGYWIRWWPESHPDVPAPTFRGLIAPFAAPGSPPPIDLGLVVGARAPGLGRPPAGRTQPRAPGQFVVGRPRCCRSRTVPR